MPFGIGFWANGARAATGAFDLLETTVLTGSQAAVEFTNLTTKYASTYQHLQIRFAARATSSFTTNGLYSRLNSDSGTNYNGHYLIGTGSQVLSSTMGNVGFALTGIISANTASANVFGAGVIDLLDPFETTKNKTFRTLSGVLSDSRIDLHSALWRNTASVTTWTVFAESGNLASGTRVSLYGLKAA